jgi:hypothetical protein
MLVVRKSLSKAGHQYFTFVLPFEELIKSPHIMRNFKVEQKYLAAMTVAEAINRDSKNIPKAKPFMEYVAESDDREFMSALFTFLERSKRREVFTAVRNNETIVKCLELTGRALL